MSKCVVYVTVA